MYVGVTAGKEQKELPELQSCELTLRNMSDLAFRVTNSPSCLQLIGGAEGLWKV